MRLQVSIARIERLEGAFAVVTFLFTSSYLLQDGYMYIYFRERSRSPITVIASPSTSPAAFLRIAEKALGPPIQLRC